MKTLHDPGKRSLLVGVVSTNSDWSKFKLKWGLREWGLRSLRKTGWQVMVHVVKGEPLRVIRGLSPLTGQVWVGHTQEGKEQAPGLVDIR